MTIGNQLKKQRQKKHLNINDVYLQTHIHPNVLNALEEDRYDKILNRAYVRSFLREYATFLGSDVYAILSEYDKLHPKNNADITTQAYLQKKSSNNINIKKVLAVTRIAAISALAILAFTFLVKASVFVKDKISKKLTQRAERIELARIEKEKEIAKQPKPEPIKKPEAVQKPVQKLLKKRPPSKPDKISIPATEKLKLAITVTDDVWIQLKADGEIISQIVLKKGSAESWEADKDFTLWTGNAACMGLELNGYDLGSLGSGVKRDIVIDREGIRKPL